MKNLIKLDRLAAWVLLLGMVLYFISGFGMTKGIISQEMATKLHLDWLTLIVLFAFVFHAGFATRLALIRWRIWNGGTGAVWAVFFLAFLSYFVYVDRFYQPNNTSSKDQTLDTSGLNVSNSQSSSSDSTATSSNSSSAATSASGSDSVSTGSSKVFNAATLAKYDGKNGNSAYVAVDGKVYDLTAVFIQGKHFSHFAGKELTNSFYSYHAARALAKYPIVGTFSN